MATDTRWYEDDGYGSYQFTNDDGGAATFFLRSQLKRYQTVKMRVP